MPHPPRSTSSSPPPIGPVEASEEVRTAGDSPPSGTTPVRSLPLLPMAIREPSSQRRARSRRIDDRDFQRQAFSKGQRRIIRAFSEAMFSEWSEEEGGGTAVPAAGGEGASERRAQLLPARPELADRLTRELEVLVGSGSSDLRRGYRVLSWVLEWLPLFVIGAFSRMSRLPIERRLAYLEGLEHARIGLLAALLVAFKIPLSMLAYELDPELHLSGFDRPHTFSRRQARRGEP